MLLLLSHEPGQKTATHCTQTGVWHWNTWADKGRWTTDAEQTSKWCPYWREPDQHRCRSTGRTSVNFLRQRPLRPLLPLSLIFLKFNLNFNQIPCDDTILWLMSFDWWNQWVLYVNASVNDVGEVNVRCWKWDCCHSCCFFPMKTVSNSSFFCHSCNSLIVG